MSKILDLESKRTALFYMLFPKKAIPSEGPKISQQTIFETQNETDVQLLEHLQDLRIYAVLMLDAFASEPNGNSALSALRKIKDIMQIYYYDPTIWSRARQIKQDQSSNEYQMATAMCRDEAEMFVRAHKLTKEQVYINEARSCLNEAIELADPETSERALACMVLATINRKYFDEPVDTAKFKNNFQTVVRLCPQAGGKDRKNAVTWMYTKEMWFASKRVEAVKNMGQLIFSAGIKSIYYPLKEVAIPFFAEKRRQTLTDSPVPEEFILK